ncbi:MULTISPECIES: tetratricopeptide repeat protein [Pseudofrankia]|uniref:tetratricopeptide repeat protein n=1 Tax=Pseudofrankia TaxID=2994363 RepID=UPI000234CB95|nr:MULTISPECIES: tetratricopeptide repeat protein [Pseudofrankia]
MTTLPASVVGPYVGARPYQTHEHRIFHGRAAASQELVDLCADNRVVVVHGPSGVGKTSLVQAGAMPLLQARGVDVLPVGQVTGRLSVPLAAMPEHNPYIFALLSSWSPAESPGQLVEFSIAEFVRRLRVSRYVDGSRPMVAVIDRLDSVVSGNGRVGVNRLTFFDQLAELIDVFSDFRLVLCVRDESLPALEPFVATLGGHAAMTFGVSRLAPHEAFQAILAPTAGTGRSMSVDAAEELLRAIRSETATGAFATRRPVLAEAVEPVLVQIACQALWAALPVDLTMIDADDVRRHVDVDGAIGAFLAAAVTEVADLCGVSAPRLGDWLRVVAPGQPGESPGWRPEEERPSASVIRALVDRHVIRVAPPTSDAPEPPGGRRDPTLLSGRFRGPSRDLVVPGGSGAGRPATATVSALLETAEAALADDDLMLAERQALRVVADPQAVTTRDLGRAASLLGDVYFRGGRLDEAGDKYRLAANYYEMAQDHAAVGWLLVAQGRLLLETGQYAGATAQLGAAVGRLPSELVVKIELARALRLAGNLRAAVACFGSVLTIAPDAVEALAGRGEIHAALRDYADALDDLDNALRLRPGIGTRPTVRTAREAALAGLGHARETSGQHR